MNMRTLILSCLTIILCTACQNDKRVKPKTDVTFNIPVENIRDYLKKRDNENGFNGTILIAEDKKVLLSKGYGFENDKERIANRTGTKYGMASISKMFAAVSIMKLKETQQLKLDQTIGRILPDYPNKEARDNITIEQLLSHTSGLGDFFTKEYFDRPENSVKSLDDYLPFFVNDSLSFQPGSQFGYSNAGFIVLGLIIERISNKSYTEYIKETILEPIGMLDTEDVDSPAGGGKTTVLDLHKFVLALKVGRIVTKETLDSMKIDHYNNGYGYGLTLNEVNGTRIYGHSGGAPGVSGEVEIVENSPLIIISLSNRGIADGLLQANMYMRKEFFGTTPEIESILNTEDVIEAVNKVDFSAAKTKLNEVDMNISARLAVYRANQFFEKDKFEKAIDILRLTIEAYPDDWNLLNSLAGFYLKSGDAEQAIKNYRKALEINPENQQAIEQLEELVNN